MPSLLPERRMFRVAEAASMLGLSASFLNKLRFTGKGPPFRKVGKAVLYDPVDLEAWLAGHRRTSTSGDGGEK
jgi:predicted DNA-binding transcriptional regulator AlpA